MPHINFEFKATTNNLSFLENKFLELNPKFIGEDHQADTYFNVEKGRLKLREGNIENSLIYYERKDVAGAKQSDVILFKYNADPALKDILIKVHGIKVVVNKTRRIYFIEKVKFHFDTIESLGTFVEVEAIDATGSLGIEKLKQQCRKYQNFFGFADADLISLSYSDMLLAK